MNNFFIAGPVVTGENFFGRKTLMTRVQRIALSETSVLLIGERRIGKTSILKEFQHRTQAVNNSLSQATKPVFINTYGFVQESSLWLAREIAAELLHWGKSQSPEISQIIQKSLTIDSTHVELIRCLRKIRERDFQVTLLLDEIDAALIDGPPQTAGIIRAIATEGHITILATSYLNPINLEIASRFGSPWHNFFRVFFIGLFDDNEATEMLTVLSEKSGRQFTEAECAFLKDVFGNFPYYLQLAGSYVFEDGGFMTCSPRFRTRLLMQAIANTSRQLEFVWPHSIRWLPNEVLEVLVKIAHDKSSTDKKRLQILLDRGLVVEEGGKYRVYSRAFQEFLKQLPEVSILDKAKDSKAWESLKTFGSMAFETALKKSIEIAAETYLGKP
jgi:hypothetical protein